MRQPRRTRLLLTGTALFHLLTPHLERLERTLGGDAEHRRAHACPRERLPIAIIEAYVGVGTIMAAVVHLGPDVWRRRIAVRLGQWRRLARLGPAPPLSLQLVVSPTIRELAPTLPTGCAFLDGTLTRVPHTPRLLHIGRCRDACLRRAGAPRHIRAAAAASPSAQQADRRGGTDGRGDNPPAPAPSASAGSSP